MAAVSTLLMSGAMMLASWSEKDQDRGLRLWATAIGFQGIGWVLLGLRGSASDFLSVVIANSLLVLSVILIYHALNRFRKVSLKPRIYLVAGVIPLLLTFFCYVKPDIIVRALIVAVALVIVATLCVKTILSVQPGPKPFSHWLTMAGFSASGLIAILRVLHLLLVPDPLPSLFARGPVQNAFIVGQSVIIIILTFGFMLMCNDQSNAELQAALREVRTLSGLLPICASCKSVRNDQGYWQQIESYLREHTDTVFSHGICPECFRRLYPQFKHLADQDANSGTGAS